MQFYLLLSYSHAILWEYTYLVVAAQILALLAHDLAQPLLDFRVVHIVVVYPALVAGVIGRIDAVSYTHLKQKIVA